MTRLLRMLAATYTQGGTLLFDEIPVPEIESDEILLRIRAASICGTDVKIVHSGHRKLPAGRRIVLGHEFVGVIEQVGRSVEGFRLGERVGVAPNAGCGRCDACIRGKANYCPTYTAFGIDRDGGHAPYVRIPARFIAQGNIIPLPASVTDQEASLLEPFSCVVNGVRTAGVGLGDTVVIYGAGPIGLLHTMLCRAAGAARLIVVDPVPARLHKARELGCDQTFNPLEDNIPARVRDETDGRGADVVITACPISQVQTEAVQLLAPFGRLCLFGGLPTSVGPVPLDTNAIHYGNFIVTGTTGGSVEDYRPRTPIGRRKRVDLTRCHLALVWASRSSACLRGGAGGERVVDQSYWVAECVCNGTVLVGHRRRDAGHEGGALHRPGACPGFGLSQVRLQQPAPGVVEEDPEYQFKTVCQCIKACVTEAEIDPTNVSAIGIDGQMAGVIGIGEDGAVTPYDSWLDTRCAPHIAGMQESGWRKIIRKTGGPASFNHGPKILWWQEERGATYERIGVFRPTGWLCRAMRLCELERLRSALVDKSYLHFSGFADNVGDAGTSHSAASLTFRRRSCRASSTHTA